MHISGPQLQELTEVVEDTIEYFCDKEQVSGELAWTVLECLATAKIAELKGELASADDGKRILESIDNFVWCFD